MSKTHIQPPTPWSAHHEGWIVKRYLHNGDVAQVAAEHACIVDNDGYEVIACSDNTPNLSRLQLICQIVNDVAAAPVPAPAPTPVPAPIATSISPNDTVRVRLTQFGKILIVARVDALNAELQKTPSVLWRATVPAWDKDGWIRGQFHDIVANFSECWHAGVNLPFTDMEKCP